MGRGMKTKRKLSDFGELTQAEQQIADEIDSGDFIVLGDGELPPENAGDDRKVRVDFIRYLAIGGGDACKTHEKGLRVFGALIEDSLDLEGCDLGCDLGLLNCRFMAEPTFQSTSLDGLFLNGSHLHKGLNADVLRAKGNVFLRNVKVEGEVRLLGAKLGGNLECSESILNGPRDKNGNVTGPAFSADGLEAKGTAFLRNVKVEGEVRLLGAKLGGNLDCSESILNGSRDKNGNVTGAAFSADGLEAKGTAFLRNVKAEGEVRLLGAKIGGSLDCIGAILNGPRDGNGNVTGAAFSADGLEVKGDVFLQHVKAEGAVRLAGAKLGGNLEYDAAKFSNAVGAALSLDGINVAGALFWRNGADVQGGLVLTAATVGILHDDPDCWPKVHGDLMLDRFRYGAITSACVDAKTRKKWLALQDPARFGKDFWPQPYEQLAKVLREMGHRGDAREILIEKEKLQRADKRKRLRRGYLYEDAYWFGFWDLILAVTVSYGHRPLRAVLWLFGVWLLGAVVFSTAASNGAFKPNSSRILLTEEWVGCAGQDPSQLACYLATDPAQSYPKLNAFVYSADTLLPIVDLEMQSNWIPDENVMPWARRYLWLQIIMGWALSLLAVAGFSGLIKSD